MSIYQPIPITHKIKTIKIENLKLAILFQDLLQTIYTNFDANKGQSELILKLVYLQQYNKKFPG